LKRKFFLYGTGVVFFILAVLLAYLFSSNLSVLDSRQSETTNVLEDDMEFFLSSGRVIESMKSGGGETMIRVSQTILLK